MKMSLSRRTFLLCCLGKGCRNVLHSNFLLDIFIMLAELFIIEPKLIHKVGGHLLDLIVGEGLRGGGQRKLFQVICLY